MTLPEPSFLKGGEPQHGEPIARIAERSGVSYNKAWSQIRRAVAELSRKGGTTLDAVRWQQWVLGFLNSDLYVVRTFWTS